MNYYSIYNKKTAMESLPLIIRAHTKDHEIFYVTFTFENLHRDLPKQAYTNYFKSFYQIVNQVSVNHRRRYPKRKIKMILVPELSYKCKSKHMVKAHHFHGFIMIPKATHDKFRTKCVANVIYTRDENTDRPMVLYELRWDILKQDREWLRPYSVQVELLHTETSIVEASGYITKKFEIDTKPFQDEDGSLCFDLNDLRKFQKPLPVIDDKNTYDNPYFSYDDIQLFCDFTKPKKLKRKRINRCKTPSIQRDLQCQNPSENL